MPIPELAVFEDFLMGARVVREKPLDGLYEPVLDSETSNRGEGVNLWFSYSPGVLQLNSMLAKIEESLIASDSPATRSIALSVLALIVDTSIASRRVEHANRVLESLRPAELSLNFVAPSPPPRVDIRADLGPVKCEPFDPAKLQYWATRGNSQWPVAPDQLRGRVAFVSHLRGLTLIDTDQVPPGNGLARISPHARIGLTDAYYQAVVDAMADRLTANTASQLSLIEAAGIGAFDLTPIRQWSLGVHLFTWPSSPNSKAGCWAIFHSPGLLLNTPPTDTWRSAREWLRGEFGLDDLSARDRPIDLVAQTFAGLIQDARSHLARGRAREAFLYFVIALDQLLGEEGRNTSTVADRASVLTHAVRGNPFETEVSAVRRVYEVRSRFVHAGSPVTPDDVADADEIARAVLWAITRVSAGEEFKTRDEWVAKIDSIAHLLRGDADLVTSDRLAAVGSLPSFRTAPPPLLRNVRRHALDG